MSLEGFPALGSRFSTEGRDTDGDILRQFGARVQAQKQKHRPSLWPAREIVRTRVI